MKSITVCTLITVCLCHLTWLPEAAQAEEAVEDTSKHTAASESAGESSKLEKAEAILDRLLKGNERFAEDHPRHPHERKSWRDKLSSGQHPVACILGCSDSRVPPELLFDQGFGDLFVVRVAGNVIDTDVTASVEYATDHLDVPLVIVLGHEGCGAVAAALLPQDQIDREPLEIHKLIDQIAPACLDSEGRKCAALEAVEHNVEQSVRLLRQVEDLKHGIESRRFKIVGAVYSLETGKVRVLEKDRASKKQADLAAAK